MNIAVAGCGSISSIWLKYALSREDLHITALIDINSESAKIACEKYNLKCPVFNDIESALTYTHPDLVFDLTLPDARREIVTKSLTYGCSVFSEKPMALSVSDAQQIIELSEKTNKSYSIMQNRRYSRNIRALKDIVVSGYIGETSFVNADFFTAPHFGGFRDAMDNPLLIDMAIHTFDQARFIMGKNPVSVYTHEFNPEGSWYKGNACAICIFEMEDGSVFNYRGSWCSEGVQTSWDSQWRVIGSKGTAVWDGFNNPYYEYVKDNDQGKFINNYERKELSFQWEGRDGHYGCLDEMFNALYDNRKAETDCRDNINSIAMVYAAIESASLGKKVFI